MGLVADVCGYHYTLIALAPISLTNQIHTGELQVQVGHLRSSRLQCRYRRYLQQRSREKQKRCICCTHLHHVLCLNDTTMVSILSPKAIRDHPPVALTTLFLGWKLCIVVIALASPGIGYDSSTSLLSSKGSPHQILLETPTSLTSPWFKFVRWDAIYFTHISQQGHVYEQEWAFGMGISTVLSWIAACRESSQGRPDN